MKQNIKKYLPPFILNGYNRFVSRAIIKKKYGSWFDVDWNSNATERPEGEWVEAYDRYWENLASCDLCEEDIERLRSAVGNPDSLLDAGCGDGFLLSHFVDHSEKIAGIDLSGKGLLQARRRLGIDADLTQCFLEHLPFKDRAYDTVMSTHTLEHVRNIKDAASELKRITRNKLIILVPSQDKVVFSEDYHIHYWPKAEDLQKTINLPEAQVTRHHVPPGICAYSGDILLLVAERDPETGKWR